MCVCLYICSAHHPDFSSDCRNPPYSLLLAVRAERNAHVNIKCVTGVNDVSAT